MTDNRRKRLLNITNRLTKNIKKRVESAKSSDAKVEAISSGVDELYKSTTEVIENEESIKGGNKVITLESIGKDIKIIEANQYAQGALIMGLIGNRSEASDGVGNDSNSDKSLMDKLKDLFDFDGDGVMSLLGIGSLGKSLLGFATNPYVLVSLASLAAIYALYKKIEKDKIETHELIRTTDTKISGTTQEATEDLFSKYSGGKSINWYLEMLSDPKISNEEKTRLKAELDSILNLVKGESASVIPTQVVNKESVSTTAANFGANTKAINDDIMEKEKWSLTTWDKIKGYIFGENQDKLFSDTLSAIDLSALGSIGGDSVSATDAINNLTNDYGSLYKVNSSNINFNINLSKGPEITRFNYIDPLRSLKQIVIEYVRLTKLEGKLESNEEKEFTDMYEGLFISFTRNIGTKFNSEPYYGDQELTWNGLRARFNPIYYSGEGKNYARSIYELMPKWSEIQDVYYSKSFDTSGKKDNSYASLMTIAQQCSLLGVTLDEHSVLLDMDKKFYFLPINFSQGGRNYILDTKTRVTLNSTGILKAYKASISGNFSLDEFASDYDLLGDTLEAQNLRQAYNEAADSIGIVHMGDYTSDVVIMNQIGSYSGLDEKDQFNLAKKLEGYSYQDLADAYYSQSGDVYNDLLSVVGNKNNLNTLLGLVSEYQFGASTHSNDIIDSYNAMNESSPNGEHLTQEDYSNILDRISKSKYIRDVYMTARNEGNKSKKGQLYKMVAELIGLPIGWMSDDQLINYIDRIFMNYTELGLHDEEANGGIDLDAAIHAYMGVSGFGTEDLSATVDLWGLGTADELVAKGWSPGQVAEFIRVASQKIDSQAVANKSGSFDTVYNQSGVNNSSESVKMAILDALNELGVPGSLKNLLLGQSLMTSAQAQSLYQNSAKSASLPRNYYDLYDAELERW